MEIRAALESSKFKIERLSNIHGQASRRVHIVAIAALALCLFSACAPLRYPPAGKSVSLTHGEALVFGRISMVNANNDTQYQAFWPDPWGEPFFGPGPRMTLELRWLNPKSKVFNYISYPAPSVEKDGYFYWILKPGDYLLLGNPDLLGSKNFYVENTRTLAHFHVSPAGGTIYLGSLIISIKYDLADFVISWNRGEAQYEISNIAVIDERESAFEKLRTRFTSIQGPTFTELMSPE